MAWGWALSCRYEEGGIQCNITTQPSVHLCPHCTFTAFKKSWFSTLHCALALSPASKSFLLLWGFNDFYIFLLYMVYGMLILHSSTLFSWACQKQASLKDKSCSTGFHRCTVWPSFIFQASCIFKQPLSILPVFVPVSSCLGLLLSVGCMTVCHTNSWPVGFGVLTVVLRGLVDPRMSFLTKIYEHISRLEM